MHYNNKKNGKNSKLPIRRKRHRRSRVEGRHPIRFQKRGGKGNQAAEDDSVVFSTSLQTPASFSEKKRSSSSWLFFGAREPPAARSRAIARQSCSRNARTNWRNPQGTPWCCGSPRRWCTRANRNGHNVRPSRCHSSNSSARWT